MALEKHALRCPPEQVWDEVALGVRKTDAFDDHEALLEHAADCAECALRLREAIEVFEDAPLDGESEWVEDVVARHSSLSNQPNSSDVGWNVWRVAAAAAILLTTAGGVWWTTQRGGTRSDEAAAAATVVASLADAYSQQRPFEMRLPAAAHGPIRTERGLGDKPIAILESELAIRKALEEPADIAGWVHAAGRLDLLSNRPGPAALRIEEALDLGGETAELMTELGVARLAVGDALGNGDGSRGDQGSSASYMAALDAFGRALQLNPDDPAALFNRAIALEKLSLYSEAFQAWSDYLEAAQRIGDQSAWLEEARARREAVERLLGWMFSPERRNVANRLPEERLARALEAARSMADLRSDPTIRELARTLEDDHRDPWLRAFVESEGRDEDLRLLSRAAILRRTISAFAYGDLPARLEELLVRHPSGPWRSWIEFELTYFRSHTSPSEGCAPIARNGAETARLNGFSNFLTHSLLELSTCEIASGGFENADAAQREAIAVALRSGFPVALTRALGFQANYLGTLGRHREALSIIQERSLAIREGDLPLLRLHQFLVETRKTAAALDYPFAALSAARESANLSDKLEASANELIIRFWAGEHARDAGLPNEASRQYRLVAALANQIEPHTSTENVYSAFSKVALAQSSRDLDELERLNSASRSANNVFWRLPYLLQVAELKYEAGRLADAGSDADEVISLLADQAPDGQLAAAGSVRWRQTLRRAFELKILASIDAGQPARAFEDWQRYRVLDAAFLGFEQLAAHADPVNRSERLPLHLSVVRLRDRYAIWTAGSDTTVFRWADWSADEIDRHSRQLKRMCSRKETPKALVDSSAAALAAVLFKGSEGALKAAVRVELALSGEVREAPIHLLPVAGLGPLGLAREVAYKFSPREWNEESAPYQSSLIVAASQLAPGRRADYPYLPGLEQEALSVAKLFPAAQVLVGSAAQSGIVEQAFARQDVFHYIGHSFIEGATAGLSLAPGNSGIGDQLDVAAIRGRAPRLAFLAACSTGDPQEPGTAAPHSLAQAFLREGASVTVSALWDLDTISASEASGRFYEALVAGKTPAQALVVAAQAIRRAGRDHPYYWAPLVLSM